MSMLIFGSNLLINGVSMPVFNEIELAISAHASWKQRLAMAIIAHQCDDITPEQAADDTHCAFGHWLYKDINPEYKHGPLYDEICNVHKQFHKEAGAILALVTSGKEEEAKQRMIQDGEYIRLSDELITLLREWQLWLTEHKL